MVRPGRDLLTGRVEVDECYVGGLEEGLRGRLIESSRMLKKSLTALLVETKARLHVSAYARNRYPAEFDVQLPVTGRARTSKPSAAADSADGR